MREILFRGKRVDNGEWIEGYFAKSGDRTFIIVDNDFAVGYVKMKEVVSETVRQYTGLTDKKGKKIFEGDIVKEPDVIHEGRIQIKGDISQIMNLYGCLCVVKNNHVKNFLGNGFHKVEVIGNIYDNLVKLKGEDE